MAERVLVPLDGSALAEQALPYARAIAGAAGQLILLEVGEDEDECDLPQRLPGIPARLECLTGDPAEQILRIARELRPDLIVMTSRGSGGAPASSLGHVAEEVTRRSPVPTLVVHPVDEGEASLEPAAIERLVVPIMAKPIGEAAVPFAQALARRLGVPIHFLAFLTGPLSVAALALHWTRKSVEAGGIRTGESVMSEESFAAITSILQPGDILFVARLGGEDETAGAHLVERLLREAPVPVVLVPVG
jgi:nucleotide-binding universal stress UspA family protein